PGHAARGGQEVRVQPLFPEGEEPGHDRGLQAGKAGAPGRTGGGLPRASSGDRHQGNVLQAVGHAHLADRRRAPSPGPDPQQVSLRHHHAASQGYGAACRFGGRGPLAVPYREADLTRLTTVPVAGRPNKMDPSLLAAPPGADRSFAAFLAALPDVLAARDLRAVIAGVAGAARSGRGVVLLVGGHVVKVGLGPLLRLLIERRVVTHVALNGAAAIHDYELAAFGGTSEDVE